jgi:hypothetical protein
MHVFSRRKPLRQSLIPIAQHVRAMLFLDANVPVFCVLGSRRPLNHETATDPEGEVARIQHYQELVVSTIPFRLWPDLWSIDLRVRDDKNLSARLFHLLSELDIDVINCSGTVTSSGENDSLILTVSCARYANGVDGFHSSRRNVPNWRLRFLEALIANEFSGDIVAASSGRPLVSIHRLHAYWRLFRRLKESEFDIPDLTDGAQEAFAPKRTVSQGRSDRILSLAFQSLMREHKTDGDAEVGIELFPALRPRLAGALGLPNSLGPLLASVMSAYDPAEHIVRCLLTPRGGRRSKMEKAHYIQIVAPRGMMTSAWLSSTFLLVRKHVANLQKYSLRNGFRMRRPPEGLETKASARLDLMRLDLIVGLDEGQSLSPICERLQHALQANEAGEFPIVLPEHLWGNL